MPHSGPHMDRTSGNRETHTIPTFLVRWLIEVARRRTPSMTTKKPGSPRKPNRRKPVRFLGSIRKPDPAHPCVPVRLEFSSSDDLDLYHQIVRRDGFGDLNRHFTFEAGEPLPGLFPWPGGKAKVAPVVWSRFGLVDEYWEPFVGSAAVFLARPGGRYGREILNDHNSDVVNVHQTAKLDPTGLVEHLETPLSHVAMEVNARILRQQRTSLSRMLRSDLDYFDTRLAALFLVNACGQMRQERYSAPHPVLSANGGQGVFSQGRIRLRSSARSASGCTGSRSSVGTGERSVCGSRPARSVLPASSWIRPTTARPEPPTAAVTSLKACGDGQSSTGSTQTCELLSAAGSWRCRTPGASIS